MEFDKLFLKFITTTTKELRIPKTLLKNQKKNGGAEITFVSGTKMYHKTIVIKTE